MKDSAKIRRLRGLAKHEQKLEKAAFPAAVATEKNGDRRQSYISCVCPSFKIFNTQVCKQTFLRAASDPAQPKVLCPISGAEASAELRPIGPQFLSQQPKG